MTDAAANSKSPTTVKISQCYGEYAATRSAHWTNCTDEAIERAVARRYGKVAVFVESKGLRSGRSRFGQIFKRIKGANAMTSLTGQVCIEVC